MTVIAWDGKTLAADKAGTCAGYRRTVTKIFRVPDGLVGFAGDGSRALAMLEWFRAGRKVADYPEFQKGDNSIGCLFIDLEGIQWGYLYTPYPERHEDRFDAIGSGRDYALAAMYLGYPAAKAIEVASALDNGCGNGIDVLELVIPGPGDPACTDCGRALTPLEIEHYGHTCDRCEGIATHRLDHA